MNAHVTLRGTLLASVAACVSWPALAQETFELDTVLLAESKREVQTDTATAETVVDQEEMEDRQANTIAELVDTVPGVNLINGNTPQGSGINIRGFGANSTYGSDQKVGIQLDGASVGSEELYRIGTQLYTDPELYKEVTVIRGMAGTFEFGSGLVGGLVRAESKDAIDITGGETGFRLRQTLQYGTNGSQLASSTIVAWQPTENFGVIGNYTYRMQDIPVDGSGNPITTSPSALPSYMVGALYTFGNSNEHALRFTYSDTNSAEDDVPYDAFGTDSGMFGNVDREVHSRTATLRYTFDSPTTDLVNATATLSYADQQIDSEYVAGSSSYDGTMFWNMAFIPGGATIGEQILGSTNADHRYETTKLTVKNQAFFSTGMIDHDLRAGVEYAFKERLDADSAPGGTDRRIALFAVDDMTWGGLTVTPAVRYETQHVGGPSYAYYDNAALMGGVSARYEIGGGFAVFGSAAYTENLPIMDDLTNVAYMSQSEKARSFEFGASFDRGNVFADGDNLAVKLNGYRTNIWDITSYSGVSEASLYGVELEASYSLASGFYTDVNANWMRGFAYDAGGVESFWDGTPSDQVRVSLGKRWGEELDLSWEVVADAAMTRVNTAGDESPSTIVHNLRGTYRPQDGVFEGAEFRIGVENLFDLDYTPHLATRAAAGRTIKVSVAKTF